eukprot:4080594-Amphidinium_carterae.1
MSAACGLRHPLKHEAMFSMLECHRCHHVSDAVLVPPHGRSRPWDREVRHLELLLQARKYDLLASSMAWCLFCTTS